MFTVGFQLGRQDMRVFNELWWILAKKYLKDTIKLLCDTLVYWLISTDLWQPDLMALFKWSTLSKRELSVSEMDKEWRGEKLRMGSPGWVCGRRRREGGETLRIGSQKELEFHQQCPAEQQVVRKQRWQWQQTKTWEPFHFTERGECCGNSSRALCFLPAWVQLQTAENPLASLLLQRLPRTAELNLLKDALMDTF